MTKKELRQKAEEIMRYVGPASKRRGGTAKEYRKFWEGKRTAICELLGIETCVAFLEFPLPWEKK